MKIITCLTVILYIVVKVNKIIKYFVRKRDCFEYLISCPVRLSLVFTVEEVYLQCTQRCHMHLSLYESLFHFVVYLFMFSIFTLTSLPITSQLSAENVTGTADSVQEEITNQRKEDMTTAAKEDEGYMMMSHFTSLVSNGNSAPENGESTPTPPTSIQYRSTTGAFSGSLKLGDDGKTDATAVPSVPELQPTSTSPFALPSGNENLLQQNTEDTGTDYGHVHTLPSQQGELMQRNDSKNYEDPYVSFVPHTETNSQAPTISPSASPTTPGEVENHEQHDGKSQTTTLQDNYEDGITTPQYVPFTPPANIKNFKEQGGTSPAKDVETSMRSPSTSFMTPDENEVMWQSGGPNGTKVEASDHNDAETTTTQDVGYIPRSDTNNLKEDVDEFNGTNSSSSQKTGTPTISPSVLGAEDGPKQKNVETTAGTFEANYDVAGSTTPHYEHITSHTSTNNPNEHDGKFITTTESSAQETGIIATSPSTLSVIPNKDVSGTQQNGEPTVTTFEVEYDSKVTTTPQYDDFILRTSTKNSTVQDNDFNTATVSSAQDIVTTTTSPTKLITISNIDVSHTQQEGENTTAAFESENDAEVTTTPQNDDFIPRTSTKNSTVQDNHFNTTTVSSAQEIWTTTSSPTKLFTVSNNDVSDTQEKGENTTAAFESENDAEVSTTPQYVDFIHRTVSEKSSEQDDDFSAIPASSARGVGMTTTSPVKLLTIPNDGEGLTQKNVESSATTPQTDYDGMEPTTPPAELFTPPTVTKNFMDEAGELDTNMPSSSHDILPTSTLPSVPVAEQADDENCTQQEYDCVGTTVAVYPEDNFTTMSPLTPVTVPADGGNIKEHSGGPNITLSPEPNKDESTTTPSFPQPVNDSNITLQIVKCKGTNLATNQEKPSTMSFLAIFKILAGINDNRTLMCDEPDVTTTPSTNEETSYNTTAKQDTTTISKDEAVDGNKTKSHYPSYTGSSPDELLMLYKLHVRMIKTMSITLGAVVALILISIGFKFCRKHRRGDRTAVSPHTAEPREAGQPSTSQASTSEEPVIRFRDLLSREENNYTVSYISDSIRNFDECSVTRDNHLLFTMITVNCTYKVYDLNYVLLVRPPGDGKKINLKTF
ncbi:mucin-5AC-like [Schistocerca cancellata]|uniref:mucin-5AC-like n=1 Tax=Schistocerca cancellata TaxID=274614 RepID=UPI00211854F1|nr:mucin-5AC-like [Schistocerca cancellata]